METKLLSLDLLETEIRKAEDRALDKTPAVKNLLHDYGAKTVKELDEDDYESFYNKLCKIL
jgi:hypothetical protein